MALQRFRIGAVVPLLWVAVLSPSSSFAGTFTGDWLELIDTTKLPVLRDDECLQISSFDRLGGNNDGFFGTFSFRRVEDGAFVLFEDDGPGCIDRIWSANPGLGRIEFYFDGETSPRLVFDSWLDMFRNRVEPFVDPVSTFTLGGCVSYVPIPYASSLKIVARKRPKFYQITYRKFPDGDGVESFNPNMDSASRERFSRVVNAWNTPGQPPWPDAIETTASSSEMIPAGSSRDLLTLTGPAVVYALDFNLNGVSAKELQNLTLQIQADDELAQVTCPLSAFFLQGPGPGSKASLLAGRRTSGSFYSYWAMPFRDSIRISLANATDSPVHAVLNAGYRQMTAPEVDGLGRFHAEFSPITRVARRKSYEILQRAGRGHWCGTYLFMRGTGLGSRFLEGDERVWVDGRDASTYHGTGTEDYFNGGWYFGGTGWLPLWGCTRFRPIQGKCDAYRLHMTDAVPFQESIRVAVEHGNKNRVPVRYGSVAFFYAEPAQSN